MSHTAIHAETLSKQYRIGRTARYKALRDVLAQALKAPFRKISRTDDRSDAFIWALKDVSFEIKHGDAVGIIGRNGAGKSTLLKILSRIAEPTSGFARIHGRLASLLEVGTGFHPELTGRENIFLNGAILGMGRAEIGRKFDAIVDFAEIERFVDTPVKYYSSGMYVRLAFSVAAHLEPEILLVDEVLAVGDAAFQKKCLGRMGDIARQGRTILFVSHNMGAVESLCSRVVWIDGGRVRMDGPVRETIGAYLTSSMRISRDIGVAQMPRVTGGKDIRLVGFELLDEHGAECCNFRYGQSIAMRFHVRILDPRRRYFAIEWTIVTATGERVLYGSSSPQGQLLISPDGENSTIECYIPELQLAKGTYFVNCLLSLPHQERIDETEGVAGFEVTSCDPYGTGFDVDHRLAFGTTRTRWTILNGANSLLDEIDASR